MQLKNMRFIKLNRDKTPRESFDKYHSYEMVEFYHDLGVLMDYPFVVLDVDDNTEFLKLREIIKGLGIKCNIMKTTRGGHFWFKTESVIPNWIGYKTPIGLSVDVRCHGKQGYVKVKDDNIWREWVDIVHDFDQLDELPFWLSPINHEVDIIDLKDGEGRNGLLYSYIITLYRHLTKEQIRETYEIINDYILADKLDRKELDSILRDEAFENLRPNFFDKRRFMFDEFSEWFVNNANIMRRGNLLYVFDDTHYVSDNIKIERKMIEHIKDLNRNQRSEVMDYMSLIAPEVTDQNFYKLVTENAIVDVRDGTMLPHTPDLFMPTLIHAKYNPEVTENEIVDNFMKKVCENDDEVIDLMYEMIGYCLLPTSKFQKAFILYGDGSNGKSTLLDMMTEIIGGENSSSLSLSEINGGGFAIAELTDKLVNVGDDISDEYIKDSSYFKKVVTGDAITVAKKYGQPYTLRNTATLIFATNNLPNMQDKSNGMIRRLCVVPFRAIITKEDPDYDPFIIDKLTTVEAKSYVLNKALEGLSRVFMNQGFTEPKVVDEMMDEYNREINNVIGYVEEVTESGLVGLTSQDAYGNYVFWCSTHSLPSYKIRRFNSEIRKLTEMDLQNERKNGKVQQVWK